MVLMIIINKVIYVYVYLYYIYVIKIYFGIGVVRFLIRIFLLLNYIIMLKCLGLLIFYLKKFKLLLKRFLKVILVIYVIFELIRIMNREFLCYLIDLIFG